MDNSSGANAGEDQVHFQENIDGEGPKTTMSAGVGDGLSSFEKISVKNAEGVCENQRPKGNTEKVGSFTMGVS